jgi:hypothetical protein
MEIIREADAPLPLERIEAVPLVVERPHLVPDVAEVDDEPSGDDADYTHVVFAWGLGVHGQCGVGNTRNQPFPQLVRDLIKMNVQQISVGAQHSIALTDAGRVFAWGANSHGQLGVGDLLSRKSPTSLHVSKSPLCNASVRHVSSGLFNSAFVGGT